MFKENIKNSIPAILSLLVVTVMVMSSELTGEAEIVFPEIAALAIGHLVAGRCAWQVDPKRMVLLITVGAFAGVGIVRFVSVGIVIQLIIALAAAQLIFMFSPTTFTPFISAMMLPVMFQTTTLIYPISAFLLTVLIVACGRLLVGVGIRDESCFVAVRPDLKSGAAEFFFRMLCGSCAVYFAYALGLHYIIAPPLMVAFTGLSSCGCPPIGKSVKTIIMFTLCAAAGSACRWLIMIELGMPMTAAAGIAAIIVILLMRGSKMYMPPAGAAAMLSMIIPAGSLFVYPMEIAAGMALVWVMVWFVRASKRMALAPCAEYEIIHN